MKTLIYKNLKGDTHLYQITDPTPDNLFGNKKERIEEKGFKAKVSNREDNWRSFRYDGVIAIT